MAGLIEVVMILILYLIDSQGREMWFGSGND